jgi:hypothetical protein
MPFEGLIEDGAASVEIGQIRFPKQKSGRIPECREIARGTPRPVIEARHECPGIEQALCETATDKASHACD